jgi:succinylglutamic semialdehyde dehydrogenase
VSGAAPLAEAVAGPAADWIGGRWAAIPGDGLRTFDPSRPDRLVWSGSPREDHLGAAVAAARAAQPAWAALPMERRIEHLRAFAAVVSRRQEELANLIGLEMGKILSEARLEAKLVADKIEITLEERVRQRVEGFAVPAGPGRTGLCRFRPHGVMAVLGPFNFPAHLPNGHIVPALLLGNAVVFKPSEKAAAVGQFMARLWEEAGLPAGVLNLLHGDGRIAAALVAHPDLDGILFTGSWPVGRRILEANLDRPGRLIALEMGGSNPAIVMPSAELGRAVVECVRASFATTGQRCTCTRRIVVHRDVAGSFLPAFAKAAASVLVGPFDSPAPVFMGPLVTEASRLAALEFQSQLRGRGARIVVPACPLDGPGFFLTPGVAEVERFTVETDGEVFAPIVQVAVAEDLDDAIEQANATEFGLAASIFTRDPGEHEAFLARTRAGCLNLNCGTAGASSRLPFGGLGRSGNHRPAGAFSVDACAVPIASMEDAGPPPAAPEGTRFDPAWLEAE